MQISLCALSLCAGLLGDCFAYAQHVTTFDSARATDSFPSGAFPAEDALSAGSGYWCSSGNHIPGERVTWTGTSSAKQQATGVSIHWAYAPGEYQVLTSADGGNFEGATTWRRVVRSEKSYSETVLFDAPRDVKALAVVMRSPRAWGFFGIGDISLLAQPGPAMLVSDEPRAAGEQCIVADNGNVGVSDCLEAIARGSGEEIFALSHSSQLVSAATGGCITLVNRRVLLQDCSEAAEVGDGRSIFLLTPSSQLMAKNGYCLSTTAEGASAEPCSAEQARGVAMIAVPEMNLSPAAQMRDAAALLRAAEERQRSLLQDLMSRLQACKGLVQGNTSTSAHTALAAFELIQNPAVKASSKIDGAFGVDLVAVKALIANSHDVLAHAQ